MKKKGETMVKFLLLLIALTVLPFPEFPAAGEKPFFETGPLTFGMSGDLVIPILASGPDGRIYCAFSHDSKPICVAWTKDGGKTWSSPVEAIGLPGPGYSVDANLLVSGRGVKVFTTFVPRDEKGLISKSKFVFAESRDGGRSWSAPGVLDVPHAYLCGKVHVPVWLDPSTVVMAYSYDLPAETGRPVSEERKMLLRSGVLISRDSGATWKAGGDMVLDDVPMGADEPAIVKLRNGDLFSVIRTASPRPYETVSHDGGLTWAKPKPSGYEGFNTPAALLRLGGGAILRVWNLSPTVRYPLVASVSRDECKTWTTPRTIVTRTKDQNGVPSFDTACYPSIAQAPDGTILVVWWEVHAGKHHMSWARFNPAWVEEHAGDREIRIVAFGDSITLGTRPGVSEQQTFRRVLEARLRAEGHEAEVLNAGKGGCDTREALVRIESEVVAAKPDIVIVMFGVNDACVIDNGPVVRTGTRVPETEYEANLRKIVRRLADAGASVVLCTPTPMTRAYPYSHLGLYASHDMNKWLVRYAAAARRVASDTGAKSADLFGVFMRTSGALGMLPDGCHPDARGQSLVADQLIVPVRELIFNRSGTSKGK